VSGAEVVDSHHHLWDTRVLVYTLFERVETLKGRFTAHDFEAEAETVGIARSICVEAASAGADGRRETEWLVQQIDGSARIAALIAWAPLEQPDLDQYLEWLGSLGGKPIIGVRRSFEFENSNFPRHPAVIEGARLAGARGLVVDLVMFSRSLKATIALVDACPDTQFVLDHLGKPKIREARREPWASELRELALRANVSCKLSGLTTEADRNHWRTADLSPYVEHAVDCFGSERLLFGSDWPVVNLAGGISRWFAAVGELLAQLEKSVQSDILSRNARRIYGV
jgi:L-fuconolactonase